DAGRHDTAAAPTAQHGGAPVAGATALRASGHPARASLYARTSWRTPASGHGRKLLRAISQTLASFVPGRVRAVAVAVAAHAALTSGPASFIAGRRCHQGRRNRCTLRLHPFG